MMIGERTLAKGQIRKLNALRKSVGDDLGLQAFAKWLKRQSPSKMTEKVDPVSKKVEQALSELVKDKNVRLGNLGYTIRRAKGKGASGFVVTKNEKA